MAENEQVGRIQAFLKTRQLVLAGEMSNDAAITAMTDAGWSEIESVAMVNSWEVLAKLRLMHEERKPVPFQTTDLDRIARWLGVPNFD
jgi:hypothetical protein